MSKSLETIRAELARSVGLFITGAATGGAAGSLTDTDGLAYLTEDDTLNGAICYILDTTDHLAPKGEWARITDHDASAQQITLDPDLTAAVGASDVYEIYRAKLSLTQWDDAINLPILEAWPEVWDPEMVEGTFSEKGDEYDYSGDCADSTLLGEVLEVWLQDATIVDRWQRLPTSIWRSDRSAVTLYFSTEIPKDTAIRALVQNRFAELAEGESTNLDEVYLLAAARAKLYEMLAEETGGGKDISRHLSLMKHWHDVAQARKAALAADLQRMVQG